MTPVDVAKVTKVYSGKEGCRCGCRGIYRYASLELAQANYGSKLELADASDVNPTHIAKVVKKINENLHLCDVGPNYVNLTVGKKAFTAYFD